jgi:hypothetical protein
MALSIFNTGVAIAFNGTSSAAAIPKVSGVPVKRVRLVATQPCWVRLGVAGVVAAPGDILVQPADSIEVFISGNTHIAVVALGTGGTLGVSPVEDC